MGISIRNLQFALFNLQFAICFAAPDSSRAAGRCHGTFLGHLDERSGQNCLSLPRHRALTSPPRDESFRDVLFAFCVATRQTTQRPPFPLPLIIGLIPFSFLMYSDKTSISAQTRLSAVAAPNNIPCIARIDTSTCNGPLCFAAKSDAGSKAVIKDRISSAVLGMPGGTVSRASSRSTNWLRRSVSAGSSCVDPGPSMFYSMGTGSVTVRLQKCTLSS